MEEIKEIPPVVALDIETTGLNPEQDRIVEIALIKTSCGKLEKKFSSLVNPGYEIPASGLPVNRIKPFMLKDAPLFKSIADEVFRFIDDQVLLIQNADFDIPFLKEEFKRCSLPFPAKYVYDTLHIARRLFSFERNNLSYLAGFYNLDSGNMHRAEKDAILTYKIFCRFFSEKPLDVLNMKRETSDINYIDTGRVLKNVEEAMNQGREICIKYRNRDFHITTRHIEPVRVYDENGKTYLEALCSMRNATRKFRLDKILEVIDNI